LGISDRRNKWLFPTEFRLFLGTENPRNSAEEKTTRNSVPLNKYRINQSISRNSLPNISAEEKTTRNSVPWNKKRSILSELPSELFSGRKNNS
jgi:hypothetical protein